MRKSNRVLRSQTILALAALGVVLQSVQGGRLEYFYQVLVQVNSGSVSAVHAWLRDSSDSNYKANRVSTQGGTEVVINGNGFDPTPENNRVEFECFDKEGTAFASENAVGPELNDENNQNSVTARGQLQYTLPNLETLYGITDVRMMNEVYCLVHVRAHHADGTQTYLECPNTNTCGITYKSDYTGGLLRVFPQASFADQVQTFSLSTSGTQSFRNRGRELPFRGILVDGATVDFEGFIDEDDYLSNWDTHEVSGRSGNAPLSNDASIRLNFHSGDAINNEDTLMTCDTNNENCYSAKSLPVIESANFQSGYKTGGQYLQIQGNRLLGESAIYEIDDQECEIDTKLSSNTKIVCMTEAVDEASVVKNTVGSVGLRRTKYQSTTQFQFGSIETNSNIFQTTQSLLTSFEIPSETPSSGYEANVIEGWFKAPIDNDYVFHAKCDDQCKLYLNTDPGVPSFPASEIIHVQSWVNKKVLYHPDRTDLSSTAITLAAGQIYYIYFEQINTSGSGYAQVSVEITDSPVSNHNQAEREVQFISFFANDLKKDTTVITIANPDAEGSFWLRFTNPAFENFQNGSEQTAINGFPSASQCKNGVSNYFWQQWNSWVEVTQIQYSDPEGTIVTTDDQETVLIKCFVEMTRSISDFSSTRVVPITISGTQQVSVGLPSDAEVLSEFGPFDLPFEGYFRVEIPVLGQPGVFTYTENLAYTSNEWQIYYAIISAEPAWKDKIDIQLQNWAQYYDRKELYIFFNNYNGDPELFSLVEADLNELDFEGESIFGPENWVFDATNSDAQAVQEYNDDVIVYTPIPYDMILTNHNQPQLIGTVDGLPVACKSVDCNYMYTEPIGLIETVSVPVDVGNDGLNFDTVNYGVEGAVEDRTGYKILITGTDLPTSFEGIEFFDRDCIRTPDADITYTSTSITCFVEGRQVAGAFVPIIYGYQGIIPIDTNIVPVVRTMNVVNVDYQPYPETSTWFYENPQGGRSIQIGGFMFPTSLETIPEDFAIYFGPNDDIEDASSFCELVSIGQTVIICVPQNFGSANIDRTMTLLFNGQKFSVDGSVGDLQYSVTGVNPIDVSPVLQQEIIIQLQTDEDLSSTVGDDFSVNLLHPSDSTLNVPLRVREVDAANQRLHCIFGGAHSATYQIEVTQEGYGTYFIEEGGHLDVYATINNILPRQGSILGGTKVTITGENFSKDPLNNPVTINWEFAKILSPNNNEEDDDSEIVVRLPITQDFQHLSSAQKSLVVGLKTSEEAVCAGLEIIDENNCLFEFSADHTATLTDFEVRAAADGESLEIVFSGSNFGTENADVYLDGVEQEILSQTDEEVVAKVTSFSNLSVENLEFYSETGAPNGFFDVLDSINFSSHLSLRSVTAEGSVGGSQIVAHVVGLGQVDDENIEIQLLDGSTEICEQVSVPEFETLVCRVAPGTFTSAEISLSVNGNTYSCHDGDDASTCLYSTIHDPQASGIASGDTSFTLSGTGLEITGFSQQHLSVNGIEAAFDSGSAIDSSFTFANGVPFTNGNAEVQLSYSSASTEHVVHYATITDSFSKSLSAATAGVNCGYGGGCELIIGSVGLTSAVQSEYAQVNVCGATCTALDTSDDENFRCSVPQQTTVAAQRQYEVIPNSDIEGENFGDNAGQVDDAFDGNNQSFYDTNSGSCYIGTDFGEGNQAVLTQVSIFLNDFDSDRFDGQLQLWGCSSQATGTVDCEAIEYQETFHRGLNQFAILSTVPAYQVFKFTSEVSKGCDIGEINWTGAVVLADSVSTGTCDVSVTYEDQEDTISAGDVVYSDATTYHITEIEPHFGSVHGGESVTFTLNQAVDHSLVTVHVDGVECSHTSTSVSNSLTCTLGELTDTHDQEISFFVQGQGFALTGAGVEFYYVHYWTDPATWGEEVVPQTGDSIHIPKGMNVLFDFEMNNEKLVYNLILIEGALLFRDIIPGATITEAGVTQNDVIELTLHAHIIFVNKGLLQAGTEEKPVYYTLSFVLHGDKYGPKIPIFGNKCIANYGGEVSLFARPETARFTENSYYADVLRFTALPNQFNPNFDMTRWKNFAAISYIYDSFSSEVLEVLAASFRAFPGFVFASVSLQSPATIINYPFSDEAYNDKSGNTHDFDYRPEFIQLNRNIRVEGFVEDSVSSEHGATFISVNDETGKSPITRIKNTQFLRVGQAGLKGKHPVYFNRIGDAKDCLFEDNVIYQSYNRGLVLASTNNLSVKRNSIYDVKGHGIALEDGVEEGNVFDDNYVMKVQKAYSFMTTDTLPAAFYITNPNNEFTNNLAHGGERFGFWYHLSDRVKGASEDDTVCPSGIPLKKFSQNRAISNQSYGLRVFENYSPRSQPCEPYGFTNGVTEPEVSPYGDNQPICAVFEELECIRNIQSCAVSQAKGCVQFKNFKSIDSGESHIEFSEAGEARWAEDAFLENNSKVTGGIFVGHNTNTQDTSTLTQVVGYDSELGQDIEETVTLGLHAKGVATPRDEFFSIEDVAFYNFKKPDVVQEGEEEIVSESSAIQTCSQCDKGHKRDAARTTYVKGCQFDSTVPKRLSFNSPFLDIVVDVDGSLSGRGVEGTIVRNGKHFDSTQCTATEAELALVDGVICDITTQIRRVSWHSPQPWGNLRGSRINLLRWDQDLLDGFANQQAEDEYRYNLDNYQQYSFDWMASPSRGWHLPIPTGHRYLVYFGAYGLDWTRLSVETVPMWGSDDEVIEVFMNHTDIRAFINVNAEDQEGNDLLRTNLSYDEDDDKDDWEMGSYLHESEDHEFYYVIDGRDSTVQKMNFQGIRCDGPCDDEVIEGSEISAVTHNWSDQQWWASEGKTYPLTGEDVVIPSHWNLLYDLDPETSTEEFGTITIYGRLTFAPTTNKEDERILRAHNIFVRGGELLIHEWEQTVCEEEETEEEEEECVEGSGEGSCQPDFRRLSEECVEETIAVPYQGRATILLLGDKEDSNIAVTNGIDVGNKNLVVAGKATFLGVQGQTQEDGSVEAYAHSTRLTRQVEKGEASICVQDVTGWEHLHLTYGVHLEVAILPTSVDPSEKDYAKIESITENVDCGFELAFSEGYSIDHTHYGSTQTNWYSHKGIDMRAEVHLISRTIRIEGDEEDSSSWGGQIVALEFVDNDGNDKSAVINFDSVAGYHLGQPDTEKAALRFEWLIFAPSESTVSNSVFYHGNGRAVYIANTQRVHFNDNLFYDFVGVGVELVNSFNLDFDSNTVAGLNNRGWSSSGVLDIKGAWILGNESGSDPEDVSLTNNRAIGAYYAGFVAPGSQCGSDASEDHVMVSGNSASSIHGDGWVGFRNYNSRDQRKCLQFSGFSGHKITGAAVNSVGNTQHLIITDSVAFDTGKGLVGNIYGAQGSDLLTEIKDSYIHGESSVVRDCPSENWCNGRNNDMICIPKSGTYIPLHIENGKAPLVHLSEDYPIDLQHGDSAFGGQTIYQNVEFEGFSGTTYCGVLDNVAIGLNPSASDIIPYTRFDDCTFTDIEDLGFTKFHESDPEWATVQDCGSFTCTAANNVVLDFVRTDFNGDRGTANESTFQVISNNEVYGEEFRGCEKVNAWNAYFCEDREFGLLHFESNDDDANRRNIYPVNVSKIEDSAGAQVDYDLTNVLNQFREHTNNGIYPGMFRLGRFVTLATIENFYNLEFTGSVPQEMTYKLFAHQKNVKVQVRYDYKDTFAVQVGGETIPEIEFNDNERRVPDLEGAFCGENKFDPIADHLQFTITHGCELTVVPRSTIRASIRMQWTLTEFFAAGGSTYFLDRLAASLNIHESTIKVASVYEGSVIVQFEIMEESDDGEEENDLSKLESTLEQMIGSKTLDMGVDIISASIGDVEVDPDYWVIAEETPEEEVTVKEEETEEERGNIEVVIKQEDRPEDQSGKTVAIIIIVAAVIVAGALLTAAYFYLKDKFVNREDEIEKVREGVQQKDDIQIVGHVDKQYNPTNFATHDSARGLKENQDDVESPTRQPINKKSTVESDLS